MADATAARASRKKKGGDPERRKQCSIHALMKRVTLTNNPTDSSTEPSQSTGAPNGEAATATHASTVGNETAGIEHRPQADTTCSSDAKASVGVAEGGGATTAGRGTGETGNCVAGKPKESPDEVSLFMFDFGECDSQRCSGRRLLRHHKMNKITSSGQVEYAQAPGGRRRTGSSSRSSSASSNCSSASKKEEGESDTETGSEADQEYPAALTTVTGTETAVPGSRRNKSSLVRVRVKGGHFRGILLSPYFTDKTQVFSAADGPLIRQHGLAVVDCSWNRVLEGRRSHRLEINKKNERVLPLLLCGNPTHYGAPNILNCAEALAGALYIAGYRRHAELVLSSFTWGPHFLDLNRRFLDRYATVPSGAEMKALKLQQEAELLKEKTSREEKKASATRGYASVYAEIETVGAPRRDREGSQQE